MAMIPLDYSKAMTVYQQISRSRQVDFRNDLISAAIRYAELRVRSQQPKAADDSQIDADRTRAHNAFIDARNILARNMQVSGEDTAWRAELGEDRKTIGDLACFIHCFVGIAAR